MAEIILRKRYGNQWVRVNSFIQPHDWMVEQLIQGPLRGASIHEVWDWVIQHIAYPWGRTSWNDWHQMQAYWRQGLFGRTPKFRYHQPDFWSYPGEVLRDRMDDCKGSAALLTSLLRHGIASDRIYMSVGYYRNGRQMHLHAWTTVFMGRTPYALDSTYPRPLPVHEWITESPHYRPFWRANDQRTVLLEPETARRVYGHDLRIH